MDLAIFLETDTWVALLTLTFLEIVLGIDNIIFISLLTNKLPAETRPKARTAGIALALIFRIIMLLCITWIIGFTKPLFTVLEFTFTGKDLILLCGGLFLIAKSTNEIHHKVIHGMPHSDDPGIKKIPLSFMSVILQIGLLDIVFSFDSILTAVGMTDKILVMILAVIISLAVMLIFAASISAFVEKHPTLQILALSFLILIGFVLLAEGLHQHIPKGYIYFAVAFSLAVEVLNFRVRKKRKVS